MTRDEKVMSEAADTIAEWRAKVASLEATVLEERAARFEAEKISDSFIEQAAEGSAKQEDEIAQLEKRIEFLEADRLRLANLIHPDTPGCDVVAGKCHLCEEVTLKRVTRAGLLERERNDYKRQAVDALEKIEQRNADVRALVLAVERVLTDKLTAMPIEVDEQLREAVGKVKGWTK